MATLSDGFDGDLSNWTLSAGTWTIDTSRAKLTNSQGWARYTGASLDGDDHFSEVAWDSHAVTNAQGGGAAGRLATSGAETYYSCEWRQESGTDQKVLAKYVAGTRTVLATSDQSTISGGDLLRVICNGTTISANFNGVPFGEVTDADISTGGVGMHAFATGGASRNVLFRSWNAEDIGGAGPTGPSVGSLALAGVGK